MNLEKNQFIHLSFHPHFTISIQFLFVIQFLHFLLQNQLIEVKEFVIGSWLYLIITNFVIFIHIKVAKNDILFGVILMYIFIK